MSKNPQPEQAKRFIEAARESGADEDPDAFKERLRRLLKAPAKKSASPDKKPKKSK